MAEIKIAQYVLVPGSDANRVLPDASGTNDIHFLPRFQAPNVDPRSQSILFFKLQVRDANIRLQVLLNDVTVVERELAPGSVCSFHEIVASDVLKVTDNKVDVALFGDGKVVVSDFGLFYQAKVNVSPVLSP
jgi:hypothetical protein